MSGDVFDDPLTEPERAFLRELARRAVGAAARGEPGPDPDAIAHESGIAPAVAASARLSQPRGAFVTLHAGGRLRGCIGTLSGRGTLVRTVVDNARSAAVGDPRFAPVTPDELSNITLEVSALTPLRPVAGVDEIVLGRHGILLEKHGHQAVFLPQVATEQGWDLPTTLAHLCRKAGLPADAWRHGAQLQVFAADVF